MKRILWGVSLLSLTGTIFAQPAGVWVTLAANPANTAQVGSTVGLTATVHAPMKVSTVSGASVYVRNRLRFTYKAQRSWPCPETITLAENVFATGGSATLIAVTHTSTIPWTPPAAKAGEYSLSVDVAYIGIIIRPPKGGLGPKLGSERVGSATLNYKVTPPPGFSNNVNTVFDPPSPTTAPVSLTLNASINFPPEFRWYRYTYRCNGCSPGAQTKDHQGASTSFQMQIASAGQYTFPMDVDKVVQYPGQSTCTWEQSISLPHTTPAIYYVNRAP